MRNVDGDQRDAGVVVLGRNRRGNRLVGLKLDDEIDAVANQPLRILERHLGLITVIHDDEVDTLTFGGANQAAMNLMDERAVLSLRGVSDPVALAPPDLRRETVAVAVHLLDEAAVPQRKEEPEAHPLLESGAIHDVAQAEVLARVLEYPENLGGVHQRFDEVPVATGLGCGGWLFAASRHGVLYSTTNRFEYGLVRRRRVTRAKAKDALPLRSRDSDRVRHASAPCRTVRTA